MKTKTETATQVSPSPFNTSPIAMSSSAPTASLSSISSSSSLPPLSLWKHAMLVAILVVVYTSALSQACFIRNCPKGGKRSMETPSIGQRPCLPCGPDNTGQCVGPNICCSPQFGCHFGTSEAEVCAKENESMTPCYVTGDMCGSHDSGRCVARGICCDSESCAVNNRCSDSTVQDTTRDKGKILRLLQRLLQNKNLD